MKLPKVLGNGTYGTGAAVQPSTGPPDTPCFRSPEIPVTLGARPGVGDVVDLVSDLRPPVTLVWLKPLRLKPACHLECYPEPQT